MECINIPLSDGRERCRGTQMTELPRAGLTNTVIPPCGSSHHIFLYHGSIRKHWVGTGFIYFLND